MNMQASGCLHRSDNELNRDMLARGWRERLRDPGGSTAATIAPPRVKEAGNRSCLLEIEDAEISGLEALKLLRATTLPHELPIIMVTAKNRARMLLRH